jgi:hypothetical protein
VLSGLKKGDRIVASLEREGVKAGVVVKPEDNAKTEDKAKPEDNAKPAISPNAKTNKAK